MASGKPGGSNRENDAKIVDRLLRELRFADPDLSGRAATASSTPRPGRQRSPAGGAGPAVVKPPASPGALLAGTWARAGLAAVLAIGLTQWPYPRDCGVGLSVYLCGVALAFGAATWGGIVSWRRRVAIAHVVALLALVGSMVLGAERVLPRVGYAATSAGWACGQPR